ncbi:MAG: hypothetical protein KJO64_10270 [Bacteroidia bacterium]|nr:hypothetical protein [Bacteroidia bacterium]
MKKYILSLSFVLAFASYSVHAQTEETVSTEETVKTMQVVEASCGTCNFGLEGSGCSLAVKIDGKAYPVDGVDFHALGDAHAEHGLCNATRVAEINGEIKDGVYMASSFNLMPVGTKIPAKVKAAKKGCAPSCKKKCSGSKTKAEKKACTKECKKDCCTS